MTNKNVWKGEALSRFKMEYGDGPFTLRSMAIWSGSHLSEYLRLSRKNAKPTRMAWNLQVSTAQLVWRFIPSSAEGLGPGFQEDGGRFRKAWAYEIKYHLSTSQKTRSSESIWTYVNSDGNRLPGKIYTFYGGLIWWPYVEPIQDSTKQIWSFVEHVAPLVSWKMADKSL